MTTEFDDEPVEDPIAIALRRCVYCGTDSTRDVDRLCENRDMTGWPIRCRWVSGGVTTSALLAERAARVGGTKAELVF